MEILVEAVTPDGLLFISRAVRVDRYFMQQDLKNPDSFTLLSVADPVEVGEEARKEIERKKMGFLKRMSG